MAPKVSIIILNWNNPLDTLECLGSVYKIDYPNFEVILVDNGSTDNSVSQIKKAYPQVTLIENKKNLGFAGGNNVAIKYTLTTDATYFLLLNNDTIVKSDLLTIFIDAAKTYPKGGAFGGKVFFYQRPYTIWCGRGDWCYKKMRPYSLDSEVSEFKSYSNKVEKTSFIIGSCLFLKKEALEKTSLFDKRFFLYYEEIDLCFRIQKAGYDCLFIPNAHTWHKVSSSLEGKNLSFLKDYYIARNKHLLMYKHFPLYKRLKYFLSEFFLDFFLTIYSFALIPKARKKAKYRLKGFFHHFISKYGENKIN